jgi:hypothetical protein
LCITAPQPFDSHARVVTVNVLQGPVTGHCNRQDATTVVGARTRHKLWPRCEDGKRIHRLQPSVPPTPKNYRELSKLVLR